MSDKTITLDFTGMLAKQGPSIHINIPRKLHDDIQSYLEQKLDIEITVKKRI